MKICFLICGQPRSIDMVIDNIEKKFNKHEIFFNICLTNNFEKYEKEYINSSINLESIKLNKNLQNLILTTDSEDSIYRNCLNYVNKINKLVCIVESKYDIYIIIRSDFMFDSIDFLNLINEFNCFYVGTKLNNKLTIDINNKINDNILITKNYNLLIKLSELLNYCQINQNYLEINLYNFFKANNIICNEIIINYKLILSRCNIIAISGDSGSGKSTLLEHITKLFDDNYIKLETDRYHKWERGNDNYFQYTHLNPEANNLDKMSSDIYSLKIGDNIHVVDYDHKTGKFTQEEKIETKDNIILCGLHTLYNDSTNNIIDFKIFMDTDRKLIKKWKIKRDVEQRGYSLDKVLKQIKSRELDYNKYIKIQKNNADIIINFYELNSKLKCKIILLNNSFIKKIMENNHLVDYYFDDNKMVIEINENFYEEFISIIKNII